MPQDINFTTEHLEELRDHETRIKMMETNNETLKTMSENIVRLTLLQEQQTKDMKMLQSLNEKNSNEMRDDIRQLREENASAQAGIKKDVNQLAEKVDLLEDTTNDLRSGNELRKQKWMTIGAIVAAAIAAASSIIIAFL